MIMIKKSVTITVMITVAFILALGGTNEILCVYAVSDTRVAAGGNRLSWDSFSPHSVEINSGNTVTWYNPSFVPEPHTVTFVFNEKTMTSIDTPFAVSNSTKFIALPSGSNSEPNIIPGKSGMNTVIVNNGRSYNPIIIDSTGRVKTSPSNASFTIAGNEQYVNSGFIVPSTSGKAYPGSSNTFTATFQKAGTYNYLCILHPWMTGEVVVR